MNKTLLLCLICASFAAHAGTLLPPGAGDQTPDRLVSAAAPAGDFERKAVSFAWALDPMAEVATPASFRAESREYWSVVDAGQLKRGLDVDTTAPGAVIRISPADAKAAVQPGQLRVLKQGKLIAEPQSFQRKASAADLQAAGMDVPEGTAIVQLAAQHGQGRFQLQLPSASGRYLVHVYEPGSPYVLKAQAERAHVLAGDTLDVSAVLQRGQAKIAGGTVEGQLVSPSGRTLPLAFRDGRAHLVVPDLGDEAPGLWEVQVFAGSVVGGQVLQRDARTAVEVSRPTARLGAGYAFAGQGLRFTLPVQVASAGRYELRGTLYATGGDGVARPVAEAHAANWFEPGQRSLALAFGAQNLPMGYGAPYELRFVELKDQSRMGTLETRELALREAGAPPAATGPVPARPGVPTPVRSTRTAQ